MDNRAYWIWLQHGLGAGSSKAARVLQLSGGVRAFYEAGPKGWRLEGIFTQNEIEKLSAYTLEQASALLEYCDKLGQQVLCVEDYAYPEMLREIFNPPAVLYVKGALPFDGEHPAIAIVGTRKASDTGRTAAASFAYGLAKAGAVVVSGGALGIDTAAHNGALRAGGKTVCVLGCGIDYNYLMSNASMRQAVACQGALVSEYPPGTPSSPSNFPIRNRIISGLCDGVLVVEAASKSGSLITADFALEQNRDVFSVPGGIYDANAQGANRLIKEGAKPVTSPAEILDEYTGKYPGILNVRDSVPSVSVRVLTPAPVTEPPLNTVPLNAELSHDAQALYAGLSGEPALISLLAEKAGLPVHRALVAATELELAGVARACSGQRYSLSL